MNSINRKPLFGWGLTVNNVNEALPLALQTIENHGFVSKSRDVETIRLHGPMTTIYNCPRERVLFDSVRDANPFFHLIESLWILSGSNTVDLPCMFLPSLSQFSDDGKTFHGAYGFRLAKTFGFDQLEAAVELLTMKPDTRQTVLSIWCPSLDLGATTKDTPCNDMIMLDIVGGALNMTVNNRSNDAIWGAYGANAVQFSMIQEWLAARIGVDVGKYVQQSNNFHIYPDNPFWTEYKRGNYQAGHVYNPYSKGVVWPYPLAHSPEEARQFREDCILLNAMAEAPTIHTLGGLYTFDYQTAYFRCVVTPMIRMYKAYRDCEHDLAIDIGSKIVAKDWSLACTEWVQRRKVKRAKGGIGSGS